MSALAVTLSDVAALAGVSQPTASRVLNGSARKPSPDVVERVRLAADTLGYIANAQAQALVRSSSGLLGLVVQDIADPYFSVIASGVQRAADAHKLEVLLAVTMRDPERELAAVQSFISHRAEAIVLTGSQWTGQGANTTRKRLKADLARYVVPRTKACVIGYSLPTAHSVAPENRKATALLAKALLDAGTKRFVILGGPQQLVTARDRTAGFVDTLAAERIEPLMIVRSEFSRDGAFEATNEALASISLHQGEPPCFFAVTDVMALGAMAAIRDAGLRVPNDVQVAGFDDIPTLRDSTPSLTTVRLPLEWMGFKAAELALGADLTRSTIRVPGKVVIRDSTLQNVELQNLSANADSSGCQRIRDSST